MTPISVEDSGWVSDEVPCEDEWTYAYGASLNSHSVVGCCFVISAVNTRPIPFDHGCWSVLCVIVEVSVDS